VINSALIPFTVEAWADARSAERDEGTAYNFHPVINRSYSLARLHYQADSSGLWLHGCGLNVSIPSAKRANYMLRLSVIAPYVPLTNDGKSPYLEPFFQEISKALGKVARQAYRNLIRPATKISIKEAAARVMREAYLHASDNGELPAMARQIMYAARPKILELTGREKFDDRYFTQTLLPDYLTEHPEETADWRIAYDARGHLNEPHTNRRIPLGTLEVENYLNQRPSRRSRPRLADSTMFETIGPQHRFKNVLFIEKEGFEELFEEVGLAERFDLAIMSTKGMSVVAARHVIDEWAKFLDHVFVLHDFDISGFSIVGTLGSNSRRYTFGADVGELIVDIGLRLDDVEELQSEPVKIDDDDDEREARRETLKRHGATDEEIEFLCPLEGDCRRVELNAMTSRQLVDFVEFALEEHGVEKLLPDEEIIKQQARRVLEAEYIETLIERHRDEIAERVASAKLPPGLFQQVSDLLDDEPELSWDQALARIMKQRPPRLTRPTK
jgi:hypothetical protein